MTEKDPRTRHLEGLFQQTPFASLPLTIAARLAEGRAPLAEIREIQPGMVLPLETPVGDSARLVAEGVSIGRGEIVELKGKLAFRVTLLGDES